MQRSFSNGLRKTSKSKGGRFENADEAEIYGFELDDGAAQMAILEYYIMEPDAKES